MKYLYESEKRTIHREGCSLIESRTVAWDELYLRHVQYGGKKTCVACDCRKDYKALLRKRNEDIVERSNCACIAVKGSNVFHRADCRVALGGLELNWSGSYKGAQKKGVRPCKICNPKKSQKEARLSSPALVKKEETPKKLTQMQILERKYNGLKQSELKAILNFQKMRDERKRTAVGLTMEERQRLYVLTDPSFGFWGIKGYDNFHLRDCPKLKDKSRLKGFATFSQAKHAGLRPCKICKPTAKFDVEFSIPITSEIIEGEKVSAISELCEKNGYEYRDEEDFFYFQTTVGKWKIQKTARSFGYGI